jgi:hypothetical protein
MRTLKKSDLLDIALPIEQYELDNYIKYINAEFFDSRSLNEYVGHYFKRKYFPQIVQRNLVNVHQLIAENLDANNIEIAKWHQQRIRVKLDQIDIDFLNQYGGIVLYSDKSMLVSEFEEIE